MVAAYPVLFLYAANIAEQVTLEALWLPLFAAVFGATLLHAALLWLVGDATRAALVAALLLGVFFGYGHVRELLGLGALGHPPALIGAAAVAIAGSVAILRARRRRHDVLAVIGVAASLAVAMNAAGIGSYVAEAASDEEPEIEEHGSASLSQPTPDIYYVILDRYASSATLEEHYGFDNGEFLDELETRGFYVAHQSRANYLKTALSLVSTFNMEYLDGQKLEREAVHPGDRGPIHHVLRAESTLIRHLDRFGYEYVHIGSAWAPTVTNESADLTLTYDEVSNFAVELTRTTLLAAFVEPHSTPSNAFDPALIRRHTLHQLEMLERVATLGGPQFVFAHFLVPHEPYVFHEDGRFVSDRERAELPTHELYVGQVRFMNTQLLEWLDSLAAVDGGADAVVILQADEGPRPERYARDEDAFDWTQATDAELRQKFGILNAYRVPGMDADEIGLYPDITPVNSFRLLLSALFGAQLDRLPDRHFIFPNQQQFYEFIDVSDEVKRASERD